MAVIPLNIQEDGNNNDDGDVLQLIVLNMKKK